MRIRRNKLKPGMMFAVPRSNCGFYLLIHLASNRFGDAFGLTEGWQPDTTLPPNLLPNPRLAYVYTGTDFVRNGRWRYIGDRPELLDAYENDPEIFHRKEDHPDDPTIGPYGAAESASGRLRCLSKEEYFASPFASSNYRQIMLEEEVEDLLTRWECEGQPMHAVLALNEPVVKSAVPAKLLSGGNPQIAKGDGDAPVQAYIAALSGWKHDLCERLDALIVTAVPGVRKAVKWNSPFYGVDGQGWFLSFHVFTKYVKVAFFRGTSLTPVPPGASTIEGTRYFHIHENDAIDEAQLTAWVTQAASLPGWMK